MSPGWGALRFHTTMSVPVHELPVVVGDCRPMTLRAQAPIITARCYHACQVGCWVMVGYRNRSGPDGQKDQST